MIQLATLELPDGLLWSDEFAAHGVAQTLRYTLDGAPLVQYAPRVAGQPITLQSSADSGWVTRTQLDALAALAAVAGQIYPLHLHEVRVAVVFRHHDPPALTAEPLWPYGQPASTDYFYLTLKLMTV